MVEIERISKSDQPTRKKEEKELGENKGSQKKYKKDKEHKTHEAHDPKKMRRIQNSTIEQKKWSLPVNILEYYLYSLQQWWSAPLRRWVMPNPGMMVFAVLRHFL